MKNLKYSVLAVLTLCATTTAAALMQPLGSVSEESPVRINIGAMGGFAGHPFGASNVGGGLGFTHQINDFAYGLSVAYSYSSPDGRIFTATSKDQEGNRISAEFSMNYMPELADAFNLGLHMGLGWGRQFGGQLAQEINKSMKFGDLNFRVGPGFTYGFNNSVGMYFTPSYRLNQIRFGVEDDSPAKETANKHGVDLPLGFTFAVSDNAGIFVEANSRFVDLSQGVRRFKEEVTLGMSFAI